ncbi:MAG: phosphotransferase family protein [Actinomycetota bacterium]
MAPAAPAADALARALARAFGSWPDIDGMRRLSGGASRETWAFDAITPAGTHALVLRRDPSAHGGGSERSTEYALIVAAGAAGVPAPSVRLLLAPDDDLGQGFVMDHIDGETIPRKILREDAYAGAREQLTAQCAAIAARIHAVPASTLPALPRLGAREQLDQYRALLDTFGEPHPAFEMGLRWLSERIPTGSREPTLVHGDFRIGNFVVGPDGIRAILDWELAHLGDPIEDLGWLCVKSWRFGRTDRFVGGFGDIDTLLDAYADATGIRVSVETLEFWVALGTLKWGVICIGQAFTHLTGMVRSVELAVLGRRVAEMEWDVLELMDGRWQ